METKTSNLLKEISKREIITEKEINLIKNRSNRLQKDLFDYDIDPIEVTSEQTEKGLKWLLNQYQTPKGQIRKNNPFGYREIEVLKSENPKAYFNGLYNAGNHFRVFYVPIYEYVSDKGSFEYYVSGGEINIIG